MKLNYLEKYKEAIKQNVKSIKKDIDTEQMKVKIKNWAEKYQYDYDLIKNKILKDEIFACVFIKDPKKQNFYELCASEFIKNIPNVKNFQKLNVNDLFVVNGQVVENRKLSQTKSIDFVWQSILDKKKYTMYGFHKYIEQSGGAQDNQFNDIKKFIQSCNSTKPNKDIKFFIICDGQYFTEKKLEELNNIKSNNNIVILNVNEIYTYLNK